MKQLSVFLIAVVWGQILHSQFHYPASKKVDYTDTYFGVTVSDPYQWLDDLKNPEVMEWLKAQAEFTKAELAKIPNQDKIVGELKKYDAMRKVNYSPHNKIGERYFYFKRNENEQVAKYYYKDGEKGKEVLLFDPQKFIEGKTFELIPSINNDGSKIAFNLSERGSEIGDIHIFDVRTMKFLPDVIKHSRGEFAGGSNTDIIYIQYKGYDVNDTEQLLNLPAKLHTIGTSTDDDILIVSTKNNPNLNILPQDIPMVLVTNDSPYIILELATVERNMTLYYASKTEMKSGKINWKPLTKASDEVRNISIFGTNAFLLTSKGNPYFKIIKISLNKPDLKTAETVASGDADWQIEPDLITKAKDYLVFSKTKHQQATKSYQYEIKTGKTLEINTPLKGNAVAVSISDKSNEAIIINTGWTIPHNFFSYDLTNGKLSNGIFNMKFDYPNLENLTFEEIEIPSWDGELVPLSIIYDKTKLKRDGSNIAFMSGYGAYGLSPYKPVFHANSLSLLNRGVIIAYAHVRGGGEKGNDWYLAGKKSKKPNTWKDFIACAEWLIKNKYTNADKLAITGASAGGILIGRAITERPDLFKVAIPKVGVLAALKMEFSANGPVNTPEFGTVTKEDEFKALLEMDAYQHIKKGVRYPAQLITTGFNDPRVDCGIPAKFAAKMQELNESNNPVLLYVDFASGHFGGLTKDEQFAQTALEYAFILNQCDDKEFQTPVK